LNSTKFFSIRYKFTSFFLGAVIIPITAISIFYYVRSSQIIQDKFSISNLINIKQTGYNIDFILNDVHQLSLNLIQDPTIYAFLKDASQNSFSLSSQSRIALESWLLYLSQSNTYIDSIYIKSIRGIILDTKGTGYQISPPVEARVRRLKGLYIWQAHEQPNFDGSKTAVLSLVRSLNDINNITQVLGTLEINISTKKLNQLFQSSLLNSKGQFFLINNQNQIVSSIKPEQMYEPIDATIFNQITQSNPSYGYFPTKLRQGKVLVTYYKLKSNWILVNYVSLADLLKEIRVMRNQLFLSIIASFLVFSILTIIFLEKFMSPLKETRKVMRKLENGDFDVRLDFHGNDEIALLGDSFNQMSEKLRDLMHQVYLVKIKQREAELNTLQAQINPHFLYNTLNTIYWMSRMENAMETSQLIQAFSKLFRLSLNQGKEFTTVRNELMHLDHYILIQKKRYEGLIIFSVTAAEETLDFSVIKLILQPLVENAIYHGIEPKGTNGEIQIRIYRDNDLLIYEIEDNGAGTDESKILELLEIPYEQKSNFGFALKNVNDRLKLYYGASYGLTFKSTPGIGTIVTVKQPVTKGAVNDDQTTHRR
jgi:two-component system, sensor histidine kinase YesM